VRTEGDGFVVVGTNAPEIRFAIRRDVLVVSTSKTLFERTLQLADAPGDSLATRADYSSDPTRTPYGAESSAWATGPFVRRLTGAAPFGDDIVREALSSAVRVDLRAHVDETLFVSARMRAPAGRQVDLSRVVQHMPVNRERVAAGALPLSAVEVVRLLVESQPASRRKLLEEILADEGSALGVLVSDLARHFDDGVGFAVERLPETDSLRLDDLDGDVVDPIPATIVYLPLAAGHAEAFVADLERYAKVLFGEDARLLEDSATPRTRLFRADTSAFGPEWKLLTPAFAVESTRVVFSTNAGALRRALERDTRNSRQSEFASVSIDARMLKRNLLDLRWEAASRSTYHDWHAERRAFRAELDRKEPGLPQSERGWREEAEINRRLADRKEREFPAALERYRASLRWLDAFGMCHLDASREGQVLTLSGWVEAR
jgi:hypothetical protein